MASPRDGTLTSREREVIALAGRGLTNQEIAEELAISARTVKCTLHRACSRLGAGNRTQAVITAMRRGALHVLDMYSLDDLADLLSSMPPEVLAAVYARVRENRAQDHAHQPAWEHETGIRNSTGTEGGVECVSS
jgi:DNA-binding CsgD family transcriptional regulator